MIVILERTFSQKPVQEEIVSDHYWYDTTSKKLLKYTGGALKFKYSGHLTVSTEPLFVKKYQKTDNIGAINKWINENEDEFNITVVDKNVGTVSISFADDLSEDLLNSLYQNRIQYSLVR